MTTTQIIGHIIYATNEEYHIKATRETYLKPGSLIKIFENDFSTIAIITKIKIENVIADNFLNFSSEDDSEFLFPEKDLLQEKIYFATICDVSFIPPLYSKAFLATENDICKIFSNISWAHNAINKYELEEALLQACISNAILLSKMDEKKSFLMKLYKNSCLSYTSIQKLARMLDK